MDNRLLDDALQQDQVYNLMCNIAYVMVILFLTGCLAFVEFIVFYIWCYVFGITWFVPGCGLVLIYLCNVFFQCYYNNR
jgi:hypothetical protein